MTAAAIGADPPAGAQTLAVGMAEAARLIRQGQVDTALQVFAELRQLHDHPPPWLRAVLLLRRNHRLAEAEQLAEQARARFPTHRPAWTEWAQTAEARRAWAVALERWHQVLLRFPDQAAAYVAASGALRKLGRPEQAASLLLDAERRFPSDPAAFIEHARLAQARGDWPAAAQAWAAVSARAPLSPLGPANEARVLRRLRRLDDAERVIAQARARMPEAATPAEQSALDAGDRGGRPTEWTDVFIPE